MRRRVVDEYVERVERAGHGVDRPLVGYVEPHRPHGARQRRQRRGIARTREHLEPARGELARDLEADAAVGAGDECDGHNPECDNPPMTVTSHDIPGRPAPPPGFAALTVAQGSRTVHVSGQVGTDEHGAVVPGGLAEQAEQALLNLDQALQVAGVTQQDIVHLRLYIVGWDPSQLEELGRGAAAAGAQIDGRGRPAVTLIGVSTLFTPDMLIEIEAVAIAD